VASNRASNGLTQQIDQLNQLVVQLYHQGRNREAIALATQSRDLAGEHLGQNHPAYASSLHNLARLYQEMADHAAALPLFRQSLEIRRTALGENHPDYASDLNDLATSYRAMGDHAAALPLFRQALDINRTALGENHPEYATSLNNLAGLYEAMGDHAAALPLYRQALEINRAALGENHSDYATSLNNLAGLYLAMGDHAAALPLLRQALEIKRTALRENDPEYATSVHNLAELYRAMGDHAAALPLHRQALEIRRTALGESHPDYALSLHNLAMLHLDMGDHAAALPLCRESLEICRTALGERHPYYAATLNDLAILRQAMGDYAAALPLHRQALEICRTALGEIHPDYATSLSNLAGLYAATGRASEAMPLMEQATAIDDRMIGQILAFGSERQRAAFLNTVLAKLHRFLSLVLQHLDDSPNAIHAAFELVLRRKAVAAEAVATQRDAVLGGKYPALEPRLRDLAALRMQIARKTLAGPGPEGLESHVHGLAELEANREGMETELARQIPEMNLEQKLRAADRRAVALNLPEGVALVEFVRFWSFDFQAVPLQWKPARYVAFVLPGGAPDDVQMIDLGEAEPIDRLIADFRAGIIAEAETKDGRDMARRREEAILSAQGDAGSDLRAALFDRLAPALGSRTRLLIAPDGDLARLPFEVLPTADGRRLVPNQAWF